MRMLSITYHVALAIIRSKEGDLVVGDAVEAWSAAAAIGRACAIACAKAGAVAFSRTGNPELGEYGDGVILARFWQDAFRYRAHNEPAGKTIHSSKPVGRRGSLRTRCEVT
jgi:hypothetical protein